MYVAQRQISVRQPDGTVAEVAPGQEVKGFADWPLWQRNVHLEQEIVVNTHGPLLADRLIAPTAPATRPSLHGKPRKTQAEEVAEAMGPVDTAAPIAPDVVIDQTLVEDGFPAANKTAGADPLSCTKCDKGPFKSAHGLRLHMGKAHA